LKKALRPTGLTYLNFQAALRSATQKDEVLTLIREAIEFHLHGMKQDGEPVPPPSSTTELVEVEAA